MHLLKCPGTLDGSLTHPQMANQDDYGARASRDLIVTRGAGFRKEKNKKKRGSYRGGEITVGVLYSSLDIDANYDADAKS